MPKSVLHIYYYTSYFKSKIIKIGINNVNIETHTHIYTFIYIYTSKYIYNKNKKYRSKKTFKQKQICLIKFQEKY